MTFIAIGSVAFFLFFCYDLNSIGRQCPFIHNFFTLGCVLLGISTIGMLATTAKPQQIITFVGVTSGLFAVFFGALLIHTLFFALPFNETYVQAGKLGRQVYDRGMYALCRHPGVLWLFAFYIFLGICVNSNQLRLSAFVFSLFNLLYVALQDIYIFPKIFNNYDCYKKTTPFLIPNLSSFNRCVSHFSKRSWRKLK